MESTGHLLIQTRDQIVFQVPEQILNMIPTLKTKRIGKN
jgi:hypothetical protein